MPIPFTADILLQTDSCSDRLAMQFDTQCRTGEGVEPVDAEAIKVEAAAFCGIVEIGSINVIGMSLGRDCDGRW